MHSEALTEWVGSLWRSLSRGMTEMTVLLSPDPQIMLVVWGTYIERQETKVKARKLVKRLTAKISNLSLKIRRKKEPPSWTKKSLDDQGRISKAFCLDVSNILSLTSYTQVTLQTYSSLCTTLIWTGGIQFCVFNLYLLR